MEPSDCTANGVNSVEPTPLSKADIERYSRQLLVPEIGVTGYFPRLNYLEKLLPKLNQEGFFIF